MASNIQAPLAQLSADINWFHHSLVGIKGFNIRFTLTRTLCVTLQATTPN